MTKIVLNDRKHNEKKEALKRKNPVKSLISSIINIIKFLHYFQYLNKKHGMNDKNLIKIFLDYYKREK